MRKFKAFENLTNERERERERESNPRPLLPCAVLFACKFARIAFKFLPFLNAFLKKDFEIITIILLIFCLKIYKIINFFLEIPINSHFWREFCVYGLSRGFFKTARNDKFSSQIH